MLARRFTAARFIPGIPFCLIPLFLNRTRDLGGSPITATALHCTLARSPTLFPLGPAVL